MTEPTDMDFLVANATEVDPVVPSAENGSPFTEKEAQERKSFVERALSAPRTRPNRKSKTDKPKTEKASTPTPPMPRKGVLAKQLTQLYVSIGTFLMPFDAACAGAVINAAPKCGEALEELARTNPAVRKALVAMVETSVWGQLLFAHAPIMLAIAIHHVPAVRDNMGAMAAKVMAGSVQDEMNGSFDGNV